MRKDREQELAALLASFDQRVAADAEAAERRSQSAATFLEAFESVRHRTLLPVMNAFGEQIESHGHGFEIRDDDSTATAPGAVEFRILPRLPDGAEPVAEAPWVRFEAHPDRQVVHVHTSTVVPGRGGTTGGRGDYQVEEVTSELVEQEIMEVLRKVFGA